MDIFRTHKTAEKREQINRIRGKKKTSLCRPIYLDDSPQCTVIASLTPGFESSIYFSCMEYELRKGDVDKKKIQVKSPKTEALFRFWQYFFFIRQQTKVAAQIVPQNQ